MHTSDDDSYRLIVERLTDGVVMLDREGRCRYVNPAAARVLGRSGTELTDSIFWDVVADPLASAFRDAFARILAGEEVMLLRNFFAHSRWYESLAGPTGDRILLTLRDVTERLQAEAARRLGEERCRIMVEGVKDHAIFLLDLKARIASWNSGAERITGYAMREAIGKHIAIFIPHEASSDAKIRGGMLDAVSRGGFRSRDWLVRRDGSRFFADVTINVLSDELGQPAGFACVMRDITEQEQMDRRLRLSEERHRLAAEAGEIATWEYIVGTGQWMLDARLLSLLGLPPDARPSYDDLFVRVHPEDRQTTHEHFQQTLVSRGAIHLEFRTISPEEGLVWNEVHGKVLVDRAGNPQRVIGTRRNVTDRHRYDEFRELLPGILAHDLRSPLSTIRMAGGRLQKSDALSAPDKQTADVIVRSADKMSQMVSKLFEFTEVRFGLGLPVDRAPTDLADVARHVVTESQLAYPDSQLHFEVAGDTSGRWDAARLGEVASNLIGNALKHGSHDKPIEVVVSGNGSDVVLKVHNEGAPIPEQTLPFIYEPFFGTGRVPGKPTFERSLGLGLYIARALVLAHGGKIEVSSSPEAGTTFTVHLPR